MMLQIGLSLELLPTCKQSIVAAMPDRLPPDSRQPSGSLLSLATGRAGERRPREKQVRAPEATTPGTAADAAEWKPLIDPRAVLAGIFGSVRLILAATIIGALIGVAIALMTSKHYEAGADLLIDPRDIRLVERELVSSNLSMEAALAIIENQIRLITSAKVMDRVVAELDLTGDPEFNGSGTGFGLRSLISALRDLASGGPVGDSTRRITAVTAANLLRAIDVSRGGKNFVVTIRARSQDPEKAALIVNTILDSYLDEARQFSADRVGRAAEELTARLDELRSSLEQAERRVERYKAENDLIDARGHLIADDEILTLNQQLAAAKARTIEASSRAGAFSGVDAETVAGGGLPEGVNSPVITELRAQYAALSREASRLAATVGPLHPQRRSIDTQIEEARGEIRAELNRIAASLQVDLRRAVEQEQKLAQRLAELKARQVNAGEDLVTLRELERDVAAQRAVYESFLLRARETSEQQGLSTANISVISRADPPLLASGPSRTLIALAGLVLGFLVGLGLAGVRGVMATWRPWQPWGAPPAPAAALTVPPAAPAEPPPAPRAEPVPAPWRYENRDDRAAFEADDDGLYQDIRDNIREVRNALYRLGERREF